jgi:serine/threonine protein kinase
LHIMSDVAKALQGLHSYGDDGGIIHRDLKPQNILLTPISAGRNRLTFVRWRARCRTGQR